METEARRFKPGSDIPPAWQWTVQATSTSPIRNNHRLRKVDSTGTSTPLRGRGEWFRRGQWRGGGGPAQLSQWCGGGRRVISTSPIPATIASAGSIPRERSPRLRGRGSTASAGMEARRVQAQLNYPAGVAVDGAGNLYIAEFRQPQHPQGRCYRDNRPVAGTGESGVSGDNGAAATAQLSYPSGVAVDNAGNLYIADSGNHSIRKIDATETIDTVAGGRVSGAASAGMEGWRSWPNSTIPPPWRWTALATSTSLIPQRADPGPDAVKSQTRLNFAHFASGAGITSIWCL